MDIHSQPTYISLFSGAGGLELAIRLAMPAARCVCYVEREIEAAEILAARIADKALDDAPIWSDVSTFDGKPFRGLVDGIVGGFPCQDLSVAGKRAGIQRGNRSGLFYEYVRIIREVQPRWVFIENVRAVLALPAGGIVLGELARLGFDAVWGSLEAKSVGASHERHRKFILAYRPGWRWNEVRPEPARIEGRSDACQRSTPLANDYSPRQSQSRGSLSRKRDWAINSRKDVDDSERNGFRAGRKGNHRGDVRIFSDSDGGKLGHADDAGLEGRRLLAGKRADERIARSAGSEMVFAPGPSSLIWNDVLVRDYGMRPALSQEEAESLVCGMADGIANPLDQRIDRLRACGNGVVALQGAAALVELMRRAEES